MIPQVPLLTATVQQSCTGSTEVRPSGSTEKQYPPPIVFSPGFALTWSHDKPILLWRPFAMGHSLAVVLEPYFRSISDALASSPDRAFHMISGSVLIAVALRCRRLFS